MTLARFFLSSYHKYLDYEKQNHKKAFRYPPDRYFPLSGLLQINILRFLTWTYFTMKDCVFEVSDQIAKNIKILR